MIIAGSRGSYQSCYVALLESIISNWGIILCFVDAEYEYWLSCSRNWQKDNPFCLVQGRKWGKKIPWFEPFQINGACVLWFYDDSLLEMVSWILKLIKTEKWFSARCFSFYEMKKTIWDSRFFWVGHFVLVVYCPPHALAQRVASCFLNARHLCR